MITIKNIKKEYQKLDQNKLPDALKSDEYNDFLELLDHHGKNKEIDEFIDLFISKLNDFVKKNTPKKKPTTKKTAVKKTTSSSKGATKKRASSAGKKTAAKNTTTSRKTMSSRKGATKKRASSAGKKTTRRKTTTKKRYKNIPDWLSVVRRFLLSANKQRLVKTLYKFCIDIQKKFQANPNREKTENIQAIKKIQRILVSQVNKNINREKMTLTVDDKTINELRKLSKEHTVAKQKGLNQLSNKNLSGLNGVFDSSNLSINMFNILKMSGEYADVLGEEIELPFVLIAYGKGGSGKSTYSIGLAKYFSMQKGKKVLYIAEEEKVSKKLLDKFDRLKARNSNLYVAQELDEKIIKDFDIVVLDSATSMMLQAEYLQKLKDNNPGTSFIVVLQALKDGQFRGTNMWEHICDIKQRVEDGNVINEKNRFGAYGKLRVY